MWKRFWTWLKYWPYEPATDDQPKPERRGVFSTDTANSGDPDKVSNLFATRLGMLSDQHPVARYVGGVAMDSIDGDEGVMALKSAYSNNQPNINDAITGWFLHGGFIGHQLAGLVAQNWLIDRCCFLPARDAIRKGFQLHTADGDAIDVPDVLRLIKRADKKFKLNQNLREAIYKGKVFGVRIVFFKIASTDPKFYEYPFNLDSVTPNSYKGMVQVDPYWCAPELDAAAASEPDSMHFYEPTWWLINGKRYHRSHLFIYREGDVADILKPSYQYGGIPLPQKIMERVYAAERTANEAPQLAVSKRTTYIKTDLEGVVMGGPDMVDGLRTAAELADNFQKVMIDASDDVVQFDTALADLDITIMTQYQLVAATAGVPGTKLLMTQPKGFAATGEFDEAMYHEELESVQDSVTPMVERHHQLVMRSYVTPIMRKVEPTFDHIDTSISWNPLDSPTAKEYAEINLIKAQTDVALVQAGSIDYVDGRNRLINDPDSGYAGIEEAERPDDDGDGNPDAPLSMPAPAAQPQQGAFDANEVQLITNQMFLDPEIVKLKQEAKDYVVQVTPALPDPDTGKMYRVVIDGHHSLEAARIDGVAPEFQEGGYGESDYFDTSTGSPLAQ